MIQSFLCYDPSAETCPEGKSMQKRKKLRYFLLAVIVVLTCAMSACRCDYKWQTDIQETQYFYYRAMKSGDKILYYVIEGLTEEGEQLENIVIPDEIDGILVKSIDSTFYKCHARKIYISKNIEWQRYANLTSVVTYDYKVLFCRYECYDGSIGKWRGELYLPAIAEENYKRVGLTAYSIANLNYFYNYEGSGNGGIHFVDDLDEGETPVVIPPEPIREGYRFQGWYRDEACTEPFDLTTYVRKDTDGILSLYAGWEQN